ncbi:MAG: hypothetical protein QNJ98_13005 [Planctomycetota bacterium]|nr:hypothetical protein [Planctomycetota bacterium]
MPRRYVILLSPVFILLTLGLIQRTQYPEGTFWRQARTVTEVHNDGLREALNELRYGQNVSVLYDAGFEASSVEEVEPGIVVHTFKEIHDEQRESKILGLFMRNSGSSSNRLTAPVTTRDGIVIRSED